MEVSLIVAVIALLLSLLSVWYTATRPEQLKRKPTLQSSKQQRPKHS